MSDSRPIGIYIHIPFCRRKCIYCDFFSVGERLADWPRLVDALLAEARERIPSGASLSRSSYSLYIGGGTPSLLPPAEFRRLSQGLLEMLPSAPVEFTVEVNPDDVTELSARLWRECGVDRVSMGVQSLVDTELRLIGRRHDSATARKAFSILRSHFANISLDLMFGLPEQTLDSLAHTLEGFIGMAPEHISAYSLMYEERTALTRMRDSGRIAEAPEDRSVEMFRMINARLAEAGWEQYEISNYARPGRRSIHNSNYWQGRPYIGLGPGAHSYDGLSTRRANLPDLKTYLSCYAPCPSPNPSSPTTAPFELEQLSDNDLREEMIMTRLRTREGLPLADFSRRFGAGSLAGLRDAAAPFLKSGLLILDGDGSLRLSKEGIMISDDIISSLF